MRTTLYRVFDSNDRLLYVGVTLRPGLRLGEHADVQPWWSDADHLSLTHYGTRDQAEAAEATAITDEAPLYNRSRGVGARLFGSRVTLDLRAERRVRGLLLRDAARMFGVSVSLLSMVERGRRAPSLGLARAIADAYGTTIVDIWPDFGTPTQTEGEAA